MFQGPLQKKTMTRLIQRPGTDTDYHICDFIDHGFGVSCAFL